MKFNKISFLAATLAVFLRVSVNAQVFEITAYGSNSNLFGDFTEQDLSVNGAGYSSMGVGAGFDFHYYLKNNLGFGLRASSVFYSVDKEEYEADVVEKLGINNPNYDFANTIGYSSYGSQLGVSYLFDVSEKFQLEPYFYFGFQALTSPKTAVVYTQNSLTYSYETKTALFKGFSYAPGLRLKWNVLKHFGLNFFAEYQGNAFEENAQRSITKNYNMLEIEDVNTTYSINAVAVGLGFTFRFGKGLAE